MCRVERDTRNAIVDGNPPGQRGGQMNLAIGFVYLLHQDIHIPVLSKGSGLGVNFLAWRSWAFGHNRTCFGIPPLGIINRFREETPNVLDRGVWLAKCYFASRRACNIVLSPGLRAA